MTGAVVAETGGRLSRLAPYVPAIADDGRVAFQAELSSGGSAVLVTDASGWEEVLGPTEVEDVISHPDIDARGRVAAYVTTRGGGQAVVLVAGGRMQELAVTGAALPWIGPAGPTMDESGRVAFRAETTGGAQAVLVADAGGWRELARTGAGAWSAFQGLPLALPDGSVVFRGDRHDGGAAIVVHAPDGGSRTIAETGARFSALGRFPCADATGRVAFAATLAGTRSDAVLVDAGAGPDVAFEAGTSFASFRGALVAGDGSLFVLGTPRDAELGLFRGPDPARDRLIAIGDGLLGSVVDDLAANPVSVNAGGQVAARVRLADRRELVLCFDP